MFSFEAPVYLLLCLLVPVGIWLRHIRRGRGNLLCFPFDIWKERGFSASLRTLRIILFISHTAFWTGCTLLIIALAGPGLISRERVFLNRGVDMMIVLDESPSMAAQDFQPHNRFETARETIRRFILGRENDPIGLVGFGYEAALHVPPTLDYPYLLSELDKLQIMTLGDGTAIGMGIAVAALHLKSSAAPEKVIILLTDGKNNAGEIPPDTAARIAARIGARIYVIGIGGRGEAPIELHDLQSGKILRGSIEGGFDEDVLKTVAEKSGGSYFFAGNQGTLNAVFSAIDSLETVERRVRIQVTTQAVHAWFIMAALILLAADFLVRVLFLREVL
ncbi:MAG: VWA domain-containing protein [Spirochaetales bacterium]|jgi:Ca-activated chloride channel family protein|nr:VWA domain-containing protein [Spirochaetales bacterium]